MRMSREVVIDRIVSALYDHEKAVGEALSELQAELRKRDVEDAANAIQAASDNPTTYGLARYERAYQADGGIYKAVMTPVEFVSVPENELPGWSREHHVKLESLWAVLRGDVRDLESRGETWRSWDTPSWSASKYYRDTSEQRKDREALEQEDREDAEHMRIRAEQAAKQVKPVPMYPQFSLFRSKKDA